MKAPRHRLGWTLVRSARTFKTWERHDKRYAVQVEKQTPHQNFWEVRAFKKGGFPMAWDSMRLKHYQSVTFPTKKAAIAEARKFKKEKRMK